MIDDAGPEHTIARLRYALNEKLLPGEYGCAGHTVLGHLTKTTQVTAIGQMSTGKTSLLNMIIGSADMPDLPNVPLVELRFGPTPRYTVEAQGNDATTETGLASADRLPSGTVRLVQELPSPVLRARSYAEVNIPGDNVALRHILDWFIETTDVSLWCTQNFDDREAAVWAKVPDGLKDNSFLVLTKADRLQMKGSLAAQTAHFEATFADQFLGLYPVATKQASASRATGAVTNPELWTASGGKALLYGLTRQIDSGKRADLDYADMLLAQIADRMPDGLPVASSATSTEADMPPAKPNKPATPDSTSPSPLKHAEALETALRILQDCAEAMDATGAKPNGPAPQSILTKSAETAQALATLLMDVGQEDAALSALREDVLESEQMILLLQLEGTETAATDAVTALLQLKKEVAEVAFA